MPHFRYRLLDYFKDRDCPKEHIILNITKTNSDVCLFRILLTITLAYLILAIRRAWVDRQRPATHLIKNRNWARITPGGQID